ncbi:MAG: dolichyl-phosphate beta-glucosyltransferase [archaeon]
MAEKVKRISLSVVIPAFNEEQRLKESLLRIISFLKRQKGTSEILVVDDGSTDRTATVAKSASPLVKVLSVPENRGKGHAVRAGMLAAKGMRILFSDADLSTPIEDLALLERHLKSHDIVIGSRNLSGSMVETKQPWYRQLAGKLFSLFTRIVILPGIKDTQCGFKLFSKSAARVIFSRARLDGFAFDVEALYLARKLKYRIAEVPVHWYNSPQSKVRMFADPFKMALSIFGIYGNDLFGRYRKR